MARKTSALGAPTASTERASATVQPDMFPAARLSMLNTARQELDRHRAQGGLCAVCRRGFPCERAVLAAFALKAV